MWYTGTRNRYSVLEVEESYQMNGVKGPLQRNSFEVGGLATKRGR